VAIDLIKKVSGSLHGRRILSAGGEDEMHLVEAAGIDLLFHRITYLSINSF
jgi:hypothetical protein